MRIVAGALIIAGVLLGLFEVNPEGPLEAVYVLGVFVGLPAGLAVALILIRRYRPSRAAKAGARVAVFAHGLILIPLFVVAFLLGDLATDDDDYCEILCFTNTGGLLWALFWLPFTAGAVGIAGGITSAIASRVGVRPASSA